MITSASPRRRGGGHGGQGIAQKSRGDEQRYGAATRGRGWARRECRVGRGWGGEAIAQWQR
eukprot:9466241-Pyramimonas_sp.AAC.1